MTKRLATFAMIVSSLILSACSVSGVMDQGVAELDDVALQRAPGQVVASKSDKFGQSTDQGLGVNGAQSGLDASTSVMEQAYIAEGHSGANVALRQTDLKPFVGRWSMNNPNARVRSGGLAQAEPEYCAIDLEAIPSDHGFRAKGSRACPTNLFMLDSWVPFDDRLVLRDHMGDEIIQLSGRGPGLWVGVHKDGTTFVLRRS